MGAVCVAVGGALGALLRYAISLIPVHSDFPLLTLATNLLGAAAIGIVAGVTDKHPELPEEFSLLLKTGFCGGFTTFSTFSLETYKLFEQGKYILGGIYAALSLALCLCGVYIGKRIAAAL